MATFYLRTRTSRASAARGAAHANYIAGNDRYSHKDEVIAVIDGNLPSWAKDARHFFEVADTKERLNGRSYRTIIFAIPNEAPDKVVWSKQMADTLIGNRHAYRLAVHDKPNNPHAHLMFSERGRFDAQNLKPDDDEQKMYFSQQNPKDREISKRGWLSKAKELYLKHIRRFCPSYVPANRFEPKIGPSLKDAGSSYEIKRNERLQKVQGIRAIRNHVKHSIELEQMSLKVENDEEQIEFSEINAELESLRTKTSPVEVRQTTYDEFSLLAQGLALPKQVLRPVLTEYSSSNEVRKKADWLSERCKTFSPQQAQQTEMTYRFYYEKAKEDGVSPEGCALYAVANTAQITWNLDAKTRQLQQQNRPVPLPKPKFRL